MSISKIFFGLLVLGVGGSVGAPFANFYENAFLHRLMLPNPSTGKIELVSFYACNSLFCVFHKNS